MDRERPVLIAAASGRALAASARRAGYVPLVADGFGDQDTLAAAASHVRVDFGRPINGDRLITALQTLANSRDCAGIVCGSGFEDRPDLLTNIGGRRPPFCNNAGKNTRINEPPCLCATRPAAQNHHPETTPVPP